MTEVPEVRYARNGDIAIAYQVFGGGPMDVVYVPGYVSHVEGAWELPELRSFLERLGSFARVIAMDRRGAGLSDRFSADDLPALETQMDDLRVVMEAAGAPRAALLGFADGGRLCVLLAASYPELVSALVLYTMQPAGGENVQPFRWSAEQWDDFLEHIRMSWGTEEFGRYDLSLSDRGGALDPQEVRTYARYLRMAASPGSAAAWERLFIDTDVTSVLPSVNVPTLILHRRDNPETSVEASRFVANAIPGARLVELPGSQEAWWRGDSDTLLDEIEQFLTGTRRAPDLDRVLATVLFTDIVRSTEMASRLGDAAWQKLLDSHNARARAELDRHRGREIKTLGDGLLAVFDGPARAVRCARAVADVVHDLGLKIRAGVHTGEVELVGDDIGGIAVHIGARVSALAGPGEVLVSSTVKDLVAGSGLVFEDAGEHALKGVPEHWHLYRVVDG